MKDFDQRFSDELYKASRVAVTNNWPKVNLVSMLYPEVSFYEAWRFYDSARAAEVLRWCEQNASKQWTEFGGTFYFEDEKDAILFSLKWGQNDAS